MKPRDLVTLNLSTEGGQAVVADLARIKAELGNIKFVNEGLRDSYNKVKGEIAATRKEAAQHGAEVKKNENLVKNLTEKNKDLAAKIKDLVTRKKEETAQYTRLNEKLDENNARINEARANIEKYSQAQRKAKNEVQQLTAKRDEHSASMQRNAERTRELQQQEKNVMATMRLEQMSVTQLRQRYSQLRRERDSVSKKLYPEKWQELDNQLQAVEKQLERVSDGGKKVNSSFNRMKETVTKVVTLMTVYAAMRVFQNILREIGDFIKKAPEVAAKAEGIQKAFNKLNDSKLLATLRRETKGLVNDILLMQSTVKASSFGIPIQNLSKYLKFAQQRAQETGESVDYLTESIINGIGRKSPLILDNLGISAARLKKEMSGGADIIQATTKIVEEELAKQGDLALTTADKAAQAVVKWENAQLKLGQRLTWFSNLWSTISGNIADGVAKLAGETRNANEIHEDQLKMVADLNVNTKPLIAQYEELSKKVKINKDNTGKFNEEEEKLLNLIDQIRTSTNAAALEWDNHGRIIKINTQSARDYIAAQREILIFTNAEAIAYQQKNKLVAENTLRLYENRLAKGGTSYTVGGGNTGGGTTAFEEFSDKERKDLEDAISAQKQSITKAAKAIEILDGTHLDNRLKKQEEYTKKENHFKEMGKKQLKDWIKENEKAAKKLEKTDASLTENAETENKKWIYTLKDKINAMRSGLWQTKKENKETEISLSEQLALAKQIDAARHGADTEIDDETENKLLARQKKELDTQLTDLENAHKTELQLLKEAQIKNKQTDEEYKIAVAQSDKKYYDERIKTLENYKKKVSDKKFQSDIDKQVVDATGKSKEQDPIIDQANVSKLGKNRDESLRFEQVGTNALKRTFAEREENEKVHALRMQTLDLTSAQNRLQILRQYSKEVQELDIADARQKEELIREANDAVIVAETETIQKRKALDKSYFDSDKSVREQYGMVTLSEQKKNELDILEAFHKAELTIDGITYSQKLIAEETYQKAKQAIEDKYRNENLQTKIQYGIASEKEIYEAKLEQIQKDLDSEKITKEQADAAIWQAKLERAIAFGQEISQITSAGVNFGAALEQAATSKLEAEYEARIAAAEGNAAEQERLEQELAQKKLDVQKEYADLQFAMKASDIIANTAVAIMMGYAQLGPIMGSIAAAMLGVTGAAQLVTANAERQKVKSMTLGNSGKTSAGSGRVVVGLETGGYMDVTRQQDGKNFRASYNPNKRGYIDRPTVIVGEGPTGKSLEYVVPNEAMKNPTLRPVIDLIDHETRKGTVGTVDMNQMIRERLAGFQSGGSIDSSASTSSTNNVPMTANTQRQPSDVEIETLELLRLLNKNGVFTNLSLGSVKKGLDIMEKQDNKFKFGDQ